MSEYTKAEDNIVRATELQIGDEFTVTEDRLHEMFEAQARMAKVAEMRLELIRTYKIIVWYKPKTWFKRYYQFKIVTNGDS